MLFRYSEQFTIILRVMKHDVHKRFLCTESLDFITIPDQLVPVFPWVDNSQIEVNFSFVIVVDVLGICAFPQYN